MFRIDMNLVLNNLPIDVFQQVLLPYLIITGLISFITDVEACFSGELVCISRRFECDNVCWFAYGNGSFRKLNNDELTDYFGRGLFFSYKKLFDDI